MNRIPFSGRIDSIDGKVVYKRVSGWFVIQQRGQFSSWSGEFTIKSGEPPNVADDVFHLVDDSGLRLGFILVVRIDSGVIEFMGVASSPVPDPQRINGHSQKQSS
jgi:hypothetical protein